MSKKTVIIGASPNPDRYAYKAFKSLVAHGHQAVPLGIRPGKIDETDIIAGKPEIANVDTVTLYVNPGHQVEWYPYIFSLKPKRIIFNPGTENPELSALAALKGIQTEEACTLVLLSTGQF